ncbi:hypothetical protein ABW21_db0200507 [Orbilia brochopaga]|nr:hypothetical protein ABW21_db0200507 [Drechslerella brochopaga]
MEAQTSASIDTPSQPPTEGAARLRRALEEAIEQRKLNATYKLVFLVTMVFESDDTGAKVDSKAFVRDMKEIFDLKDPNMIIEEVFPQDRDAEIYWATNTLAKIDKINRSCIGKKLLFLHFAGHGATDKTSELLLQGNPTDYKQELSWSVVRKFLLDPYREQPHGQVDVACVLDCCYPEAFLPPHAPSNMIVEVLAATKPRPTTTEQRMATVRATSLTEEFLGAMYTLRRSPPITFPEVLAAMQRPRRYQPFDSKPQLAYRMLYGNTSIILPAATPPDPTPTDPEAEYDKDGEHFMALKVLIPDDIKEETTQMLVKWLHGQRENIKFEVLGVNTTFPGSTIVFITVPYTDMHVLYNLEHQGILTTEVLHEHIFSFNLLGTLISSEETEGEPTTTDG